MVKKIDLEDVWRKVIRESMVELSAENHEVLI